MVIFYYSGKMLRHVPKRRLLKTMMICLLGYLSVLLYLGIRAHIDRDHSTQHVLSTPLNQDLFTSKTDRQKDRKTLIVPNKVMGKPSLRSNITAIARATPKEKPILVLFWSIMYEYLELYTINNQTIFGNVAITFNSSRLDEADIVVIHFRSIYTMIIPMTRHSWQRWVVHTMEPPSQDGIHKLQAHRKPLGMIDKMFNFTSHYSKKADIHSPYGECYKIKKPLDIRISVSEMNKTGLVLWASSHCVTFSEVKNLLTNLRKASPLISMGNVAHCGVNFLNSETFVEDINFTCHLKTHFVKIM